MALQRPHVLLAQTGQRLPFKARRPTLETDRPPEVTDRAANAARILKQARDAVETTRKDASDEPVLDADRLPLSVRATTSWGAPTSAPAGAEVLSAIGAARAARLNMAFAPSNFEKLEQAAEKYIAWSPEASPRRPNHFNFFEAAPRIGVTSVADLWASDLELPADDETIGWEIWLKPGHEEKLRHSLVQLGLISRMGDALSFTHALVLPVVSERSTMERLAKGAAISQLRPASGLNTGLVGMPGAVQSLAVEAAARRVSPAGPGAPSVCLIDTGLADHPLLDASRKARLAVGAGDGLDADNGHGTRMAGLALFEDLPGLLNGNTVDLTADLESVAVEPPPDVAPSPLLAAARVRVAVDMVEAARTARRTFCFAMNAHDEASDGMPSSLSTEMDRLAFNAEAPDQPRLFCAAAGNIDAELTAAGYPKHNEDQGIQSPAQAWNVLSIGACTELQAELGGLQPLAPSGDLSPWSRTAVGWPKGFKAPSKPDVVFEGGNRQLDPVTQTIGAHADLLMLTTDRDPASPLSLTAMTSAATASAAGFAARLQAAYPEFWEETVRGLFVHAAEHTPAMHVRVGGVPKAGGRRLRALQQRYGFGRTNRALALENAANTLTLIAQSRLAPFRLKPKAKGRPDVVLGEMGVHKLPWPIEALIAMGGDEVELRVTLSYFIEPNSGRTLSGDYQAYPSHGLDFAVRHPDETDEDLLARVSAPDDPGDETPDAREGASPHEGWTYPHTRRTRGGVKHDRWKGPAERLAGMGMIVVFPRSGWWQKDAERAGDLVRYALIASIRTDAAEIYSAVPVTVAVEGRGG